MERTIEIEGFNIVIDDLDQYNADPVVDQANDCTEKIIKWTTEQVTLAMKPAVAVVKSLREATAKMAPDEMELEMQFGIALDGEMPLIKILSTEATAQISAKFTWKNEKD